jgi:hypothetical protein
LGIRVLDEAPNLDQVHVPQLAPTDRREDDEEHPRPCGAKQLKKAPRAVFIERSGTA